MTKKPSSVTQMWSFPFLFRNGTLHTRVTEDDSQEKRNMYTWVKEEFLGETECFTLTLPRIYLEKRNASHLRYQGFLWRNGMLQTYVTKEFWRETGCFTLTLSRISGEKRNASHLRYQGFLERNGMLNTYVTKDFFGETECFKHTLSRISGEKRNASHLRYQGFLERNGMLNTYVTKGLWREMECFTMFTPGLPSVQKKQAACNMLTLYCISTCRKWHYSKQLSKLNSSLQNNLLTCFSWK